jgi:ubiquinone/menaquinone biosynthesis C-methylase UbiE
MRTPAFDDAKLERFEARMLGALNGAAIALMTSIGHRTGLFDVMSRLRPASAAEIAGEAGLNPRYVREWLGAMVTGGLVEYGPADDTYALPVEHAALLTRAARPHNVAASCQWIPLLGSVEERILECFERGGGVPHSAYERFPGVMAEECDQAVVAELVEQVLPLVPGLGDALARGIDVLDVGCGTGRALNRLAAEFPRSRFVGCDASADAVEAGRAEARELALANVRFVRRDASELGRTAEFDLVTAFYSIHEQARPDLVLRAIARSLRPDGIFLMQDLAATSHLNEDASIPLAPFLYTVSCLHTMTVSLAEGGMGLGAMCGSERAQRMLRDAGFGRVDLRQLPHDPINLYYVSRK